MLSDPATEKLKAYAWFRRLWLWSAVNPGWASLLGVESEAIVLALLTSHSGWFDSSQAMCSQTVLACTLCLIGILSLTWNILETASYVILGIVPPEGAAELRHMEV